MEAEVASIVFLHIVQRACNVAEVASIVFLHIVQRACYVGELQRTFT